MVGSEEAGQTLIELDEVWSGLKHTCLVEHTFWESGPATGQVEAVLREYKDLSATLCDMANFVFLQNDKFKEKQKLDVAATTLKRWVDIVPNKLKKWVDTGLAQLVEDRTLSVCRSKQQALFSAGLTAVAEVTKQCVAGSPPSFNQGAQQQLLMKIPKSHSLRPLVTSFLEARPIKSAQRIPS